MPSQTRNQFPTAWLQLGLGPGQEVLVPHALSMSDAAQKTKSKHATFTECLQREAERVQRREPAALATWLAELAAASDDAQQSEELVTEWHKFFQDFVARQQFRVFVTGDQVPDQGGRAIALAVRHSIRRSVETETKPEVARMTTGACVTGADPAQKLLPGLLRPDVLVLAPAAERVCRAAAAVGALSRFRRSRWTCLKLIARHERLEVSIERCKALARTQERHRNGVIVLGTPHRISELMQRQVLGAPRKALVLDMSLDVKCRRLLRMPGVQQAALHCLRMIAKDLAGDHSLPELVFYA